MILSICGIIKSQKVRNKLLNNIKTHDNLNSSIRDSNAVAILTEWDEFENYDWSNLLLSSRGSFKIFDVRNILKINIQLVITFLDKMKESFKKYSKLNPDETFSRIYFNTNFNRYVS